MAYLKCDMLAAEMSKKFLCIDWNKLRKEL